MRKLKPGLKKPSIKSRNKLRNYRISLPKGPANLTSFSLREKTQNRIILLLFLAATRPYQVASPDGLARLWDKRQFVYNLSTNCAHFVLVLSSFCTKFVTTKTTKIFVICQVLDKNKTKVRQMTNCLQVVFVLSCFCTNFDKWQIWLLVCCDKF